MFYFFSRHRFHESIAIAVLIAASITLHVAWISNVFVERVYVMRRLFEVVPSVGPISGLYIKSFLSFWIIFIISIFFLHGKDCSKTRKHIFSFFLFSVLTFFVMTMPFVYQFSIVVE